jgi:hypothetical protein
MTNPETLKAFAAALTVRSLTFVRADSRLYVGILFYTFAGLGFLYAVGAEDRVSYGIYVDRWLMLFGFLLPAVFLIAEAAYLIHRFDRRRLLAARRMFSVERLSCLLAGMALTIFMVVFQGTFTSVKNALAVWQHGFPYDRVQADIDQWLHFGIDPWRWLYAIGEHDWVRIAVEWNYNVLWFAFCFGALFFVATSPRARGLRTRYIVAFILTWIVVGNLLAGAFMSAGPAFYAQVTGDAARFGEQLAFLARGAGWENSAASYQDYLWTLHSRGLTGFGSGISAFPSVHVGLVTLNALFLWDFSRRLGVLAFAYVGFVLLSSVYLAWHYAIDGYVAMAAVLVIHFALKRFLARRPTIDAMRTPEGSRPAAPTAPVTAS